LPDFLRQLKQVCKHVISDRDRLKIYESDGLVTRKAVPRFVALPETVAEVQDTVRLCHDHRIPVVARGAGTSLSGGAMPHEEGVLLSLAKFTRILEIDKDNLLAYVEPGVTNLAISQSVRSLGLYYAPDPSSQIACTIGGNVAENAGGVHCLKYGLTVHNVRQLKIVAPDGQLYVIGSAGFDSAGFDLLALMHGSEGMLGIVVEVAVCLLPMPDDIVVVIAGFETVTKASETVADIIAEGLIPAGLEMMDKLAIRAAEDFVNVGYPTDVDSLLLCELDGSADEVEQQLLQLNRILDAHDALHVRIARDEQSRSELWRGRKAAFPAVGRIAPDYFCMDGTIPKKELSTVLNHISDLSEEYGLAVANVFHAGDGNLHPLIMYDSNVPGDLEKAEELGARILESCLQKGGTITGEHGVGVEKIDQMCLQFSTEELNLFHGIKAVFDDRGILNPGKAIPTLNRCAEFGAMHVHRGEEKFPDLERF